jgi:hypothetical protein
VSNTVLRSGLLLTIQARNANGKLIKTEIKKTVAKLYEQGKPRAKL